VVRRHGLGKFRPIPVDLRRARVVPRQFARIYVRLETMTGKVKKWSGQVKVDPHKNRTVQYKLMKYTCNRILKNRMIPLAPTGSVFDDFGDFLNATPWGKVRRILSYKVGMEYVR
jgi:hypothetical protein